MKFLILFVIILILLVYFFLNYFYQFGGSPDKYSLEIITNSKNFNEDGFVNIYDIPKIKQNK